MEYKIETKNVYLFSENIDFIFYSIICLLMPMTIGHPQMAVGIVVNTMLVLAAYNYKGYKLLPVILLPSIGVLSRGIIFGPFTMLLVFMIPFIWMSNFILVYGMRMRINKWMALGISSVAKAAFLFGFAFLFVNLGVLPKLFLTTMGMFQLGTAIVGGVIAFGLIEARKRI